jgi:hypothetical protein
MDCNDVTERLPWLLSGALPAAEAQALRDHIAGCPACQAERAETRAAAAIFDAHLPTSTILDLAWDRTVQGLEHSVVQRHLETCAGCRDELALARESRELEARPDAAALPMPARPPRAMPIRFVLPAALAAGLVVGFGLGTRRTPPPTTAANGRVAQLEGETARLQAETTRLHGIVEGLETAAREARPRLNLPLFELIPGRTRGGGAGIANELAIPAAASEVVLLIGLPNAPGTPASAVLEDATGREVWKADGLTSGPPGGYVVTLPASMLPAGRYALTLRPKHDEPVDYTIDVKR